MMIFMAIQNVYVLHPSGKLIYNRDYHSIKEDAVIISGFLSAIDSFAQTIGAGNEIKTIETDKFRFIGKQSKKYGIKFIIVCERRDNIKQAEKVLQSIKKSFIIKYNKILNSKKPFDNPELFKDWDQNLDRIINESNLLSFESIVKKTMKDLKNIFKKIDNIKR